MTRALVPIAEGSEEIEAVSIIDTFRRAGWEVIVAAVGGSESAVTCSRGVRIEADKPLESLNLTEFDVIAVPGGAGGSDRLRKSSSLLEALRNCEKDGRIIGAICAGPLVLQEAGLLKGRTATCHPAARSALTEARISDLHVVIDGNIVTSQGPATAIEFALAIVQLKEGDSKARSIAAAMIVDLENNP